MATKSILGNRSKGATRTTKRVGSTSQGIAPWTTKKRSTSTRETYPDNWKELRYKVLVRDGFTCNSCRIGKDEAKERGLFLEVDHIIRLADGGNNSMLNLQTLCSNCHKARLNHRHMRIRG